MIIEEIRKTYPEMPDSWKSKEDYLRNSIVLAFFFNKPIHECSESLIQLLEKYIQIVPPDALRWCIPSASAEEWRESKKATITRIKTSLAPEKSSKRDITAYILADSAGAAGYRIQVIGESDEESITWTQMSFPVSILTTSNVEDFVATVREFFELAQATHGYCSPGFNYRDDDRRSFSEMRGYAMRYPGYDVQLSEFTRHFIEKRIRGARWITFLGEELTSKLGGVNKLREQLTEPITVDEMNKGVMIRAGQFPEIGDVNRKIDTPLLRKVAKVLEPITFFNDAHICSYFAGGDEDLARKWERRFLD